MAMFPAAQDRIMYLVIKVDFSSGEREGWAAGRLSSYGQAAANAGPLTLTVSHTGTSASALSHCDLCLAPPQQFDLQINISQVTYKKPNNARLFWNF